MMRNFIIFCVFSFLGGNSFLFSQTGPGGVGNSSSNVLWLQADKITGLNNGDPVAIWNDYSGNANDFTQTTATQEPIYQTGIINGKPALQFDGVDDWMGLTINVPETNFSQFIVFQTIGNDGSGSVITITDPVSSSAHSHDRQFGLTGNKLGHRLWNSQTITSAANYNDNIVHIAAVNVNSSTGQEIIADGTSVASGSKTSSDFNWQTGMVIGGHNYWGFLNCNVPEIIFYNSVLNTAQRIIVENYLSSKYGITIANDKYSYDASYGNDVAGIGRVSSNTHTDAQSANILEVSNPDALGNGDFLLFGHDDNGIGSWTTTESPDGGTNIQRIAREWRFDETGEVGNITITIDTTLLPARSANYSKFVLLVDADGDFSSGASVYEITSPGSNQYFEVNNININTGDYVTIACVRPTIEFSLASSDDFETNTNPSYQITLNFIPANDVTVDYTTSDGTAIAPGDYVTASSTATIFAGSMTGNFSLTVNNDVVVENDETFTITLSNPGSGVNLGTTTTHTYTIHDDDNARKIYFSVASSSGNENISPATITVSINNIDMVNPTSADYTVTGGTATGGGIDYTLAAGTIIISPGNPSNTFNITITDDALYENSETIVISLTNPTNCNLSGTNPIVHTYTIIDNDTPPEIQFNTAVSSGSESVSPVSVQVDLSMISSADASADYLVTGGTATGGGTDYTLASGTLNITAGNTNNQFTISINDDAIQELSETIEIRLRNPSGATLGADSIFTYTIDDNDQFGYLGPGGVGNSSSNVLWLQADKITGLNDGDPVATWNDYSGNANDFTQATATQEPTYQTGIINGKPALQFDGYNDWMGLTIDVPETDFSQFIVFQTIGNDGSGSVITITDPVSSSAGSHDRQFGLTGNKLGHRLWSDQTITSAANYNDNIVHIAAVNVNSSTGQEIIADGTSVASGSKTSSDFNWQTGMVIGGHNYWGFLNCNVPEIIFYNSVLNTVQRIIVDNYLSSKYGIAITDDKFSYDASYGNEVTGIGREDVSNMHIDAQGTSIVRINNPSSLDDGDYLLWGHDNASTTTPNTTDVPPGINNRLNRVWRADETGDVGTVRVYFDTTGLVLGSPDSLALLIDHDDGSFVNATVYSTGLTVSGGYVYFTGVNFSAGDWFTIGSKTSDNPLPIELINFEAILNNDIVNLNWSTASEINNDYFTVERSSDGINFKPIGRIDGKGNYNGLSKYTLIDYNPLQGVSYYRLKQTDFDGKFEYSDIISITYVLNTPAINSNLYPNPANNGSDVKLEMTGMPVDKEVLVVVTNVLGQQMYSKVILTDNNGNILYAVDPYNQLPPGTYIIVATADDKLLSKRLIIQ